MKKLLYLILLVSIVYISNSSCRGGFGGAAGFRGSSFGRSSGLSNKQFTKLEAQNAGFDADLPATGDLAAVADPAAVDTPATSIIPCNMDSDCPSTDTQTFICSNDSNICIPSNN